MLVRRLGTPLASALVQRSQVSGSFLSFLFNSRCSTNQGSFIDNLVTEGPGNALQQNASRALSLDARSTKSPWVISGQKLLSTEILILLPFFPRAAVLLIPLRCKQHRLFIGRFKFTLSNNCSTFP